MLHCTCMFYASELIHLSVVMTDQSCQNFLERFINTGWFFRLRTDKQPHGSVNSWPISMKFFLFSRGTHEHQIYVRWNGRCNVRSSIIIACTKSGHTANVRWMQRPINVEHGREMLDGRCAMSTHGTAFRQCRQSRPHLRCLERVFLSIFCTFIILWLIWEEEIDVEVMISEVEKRPVTCIWNTVTEGYKDKIIIIKNKKKRWIVLVVLYLMYIAFAVHPPPSSGRFFFNRIARKTNTETSTFINECFRAKWSLLQRSFDLKHQRAFSLTSVSTSVDERSCGRGLKVHLLQ